MNNFLGPLPINSGLLALGEFLVVISTKNIVSPRGANYSLLWGILVLALSFAL